MHAFYYFLLKKADKKEIKIANYIHTRIQND